jgi:hypothetical protein
MDVWRRIEFYVTTIVEQREAKMARFLGILTFILVISGTAALAKIIPKYDGEPVTAVVVHKEARKMFLMHDDTVLRSYYIGLGFAPDGHKEIEGDGKTPEGRYVIDQKTQTQNSTYHLVFPILTMQTVHMPTALENHQVAISLFMEIRISNTESNKVGAIFLTKIGPRDASLLPMQR